MKRALIAIPAVLVVLIAALLIGPGFVDWNQYKEQAILQARKTAGLDVALNGDMALALIPYPRFHIENVVVKAPAGSAEENLASIDRLDVNIALLPLLGGKVQVSSLDLVKPVIALEVLKSGEGNWMTPEIQAMINKDKPAGQGQNGGSLNQAISLDAVNIENGSFRFVNTQNGGKTEVSDINLDINAETLQGPFVIDGSFALAGQAIEIDAKTGALAAGAGSLPVTGTAKLEKQGVTVDYAGVVGLKAPYEVQGETAVRIADIESTLSAYGVKNAPVKGEGILKGILTASQDSATLANGTLELAGQKFAADIKAGLKPLSVVSTFKAQESVNMDAFLTQKGQKPVDSGLSAVNQMVPPTITVPMAFDASIALVLPSATYRGQPYSDVTLAFVKKDKEFQGKVEAGNIPGKGSASTGAALSYASASVAAATGGVTYSEPSLSVFAKGQSQNVGQSVEALTGLKDLPYVNKIKTGSIDLKAAVSPSKLQLSNSSAKLDDASFTLAGSFMPDGGKGRPKLEIDVSTDRLDIDKWAPAEPETAKGQSDLAATLKAFWLPYDIGFDIGVQNARLRGQDITGLRAQGEIVRNAVTLKNVSAQSFAGAAVAVSGGVSDLQNLSGINLKAAIDAKNIKTFAQTLGADASGLPAGITAAKVNVSAQGNVSAMDVSGSVQTQGGEVTATGKLAEPLGAPKVSNLAIRAKHPNTAEAIRIFAPDAPYYSTMAKPLDISTDIRQEGTVYRLENLKATVAGSAVDGAVSYDTGAAKPTLTADLKFGDLVIQSAQTQALSGGSGGGGSSAPPKSGQWSSAPIDSGFLHAANANITATANSIKYEGWDLSKPVIKMSLKDGALDVSQLESGLFGGQVSAAAHVASTSAKAPVSLKADAKLTDVDIEALSKALAKTARLQGKGRVTMNLDIAGNGASQAALVSSLKGSSTVTGRSLILEGFDLAALATALMDSNKPLPRLQEIVSSSTSGGQTAFDTLDGQYVINNGIVTISSMAMDGPAAAITSMGNVSLPQWFIDTTHKITLKNAREVAPFDVVIKGPLSNPGNTFGKGMFDSILRSKVQQKVTEELPGLLGDSATEKLQQFGILPTKPQAQPQQAAPQAGAEPPADVAPSGGEEAVAPAPAPEAAPAQDEEMTPEKAFEGLLKNLAR